MKNQCIILLAILTIVPSSVLFAQNSSSRDARKEMREKQKMELVTNLRQAILDKSFIFTAFTMNSNLGSMQIISQEYNYMRIQPSMLDLVLPYKSSSVIPDSPTYLDLELASYTYKVDTTVPGMAYVTISIDNVINQASQSTALGFNMSYKIHLEIFLASSNTIMTIMPNFYSSVSYNGFVRKN